MVRKVHGTNGTKSPRMVRKIHGTKHPWYEKSTNGTKRLWYEKSMVRKVWFPIARSVSQTCAANALFPCGSWASCYTCVRSVNVWHVVLNDRSKNSGSCMVIRVTMVMDTLRTISVRRSFWTEERFTDLTKNRVCRLLCSVCFVSPLAHAGDGQGP